MNEQYATVGDVTLCYETFGSPHHPAMLLVMGLGTQMIAWREELCTELAAHGHFVIRFDNRDIGRSTRFSGVPTPSPLELATRNVRRPAYTLRDMADDCAGLLDHLAIDAAHVVGASMGGMIAQTMAAHHPARVLSLTSIMSTTGNRWKGQPHPRALPFFLGRPPQTLEETTERLIRLFRVVGSPGFPREEEELRRRSALSWERGPAGGGTARQLGAIMAAGDRTGDLRRITAPTLVVHGDADRLVAPSGGRATAAAIPGARLLMIKGMGHDMPQAVWPQLVAAVTGLVRDAGRPATAAA